MVNFIIENIYYLIIIILFIVYITIYWKLYNRYTMRVLRKEKVLIKLPEKRITITWSIIVLVCLFVTSLVLEHKQSQKEELRRQTIESYTQLDDIESIQMFFEQNKDFNINTTNALHYAIINENLEMIEILIDKGANINAGYKITSHQNRGPREMNINQYYIPYGITPIEIAVQLNHLELVQLLIEEGANIKPIHFDGSRMHPLYYAIANENLSILKLLVESNSILDNPNGLDRLLTYATTPEIFDYLVLQGLDHHHIEDGIIRNLLGEQVSVSMLQHLYTNYDFDFNQTFHDGKNSLHYCLMYQCNEESLLYLISIGVESEKIDNSGRTPIFYALNDVDTLKSTIELGFDINKRDFRNNTLLHASVEHANLDVIKYLLELGFNPNELNNEGRTPIFYYNIDNISILKNLIELGFDPYVKDDQNNNLLHVIVLDERGRPKFEMIEYLLSLGIDPNELNDNNQSAIDIMIEHRALYDETPGLKALQYRFNKAVELMENYNHHEYQN